MKNIIYTACLILGFGLSTIQAQDISFTNAKLDAPPSENAQGKACFTIIAEEGIDITSVPVAVEVSLSKVDFDVNSIFGFNSEKFDWEVDSYSDNVIRGTLTDAIPNVENGGGGAQVCILVQRDFAEDYADPRNGFVVNLIPGSHNQNGNTGNDYIEKFGFAGQNQSLVSDEKDYSLKAETRFENFDQIEVNIYPNPTVELVNIDVSENKNINEIRIYNSIGQTFFKDNSNSIVSINTSEWTEGMYYVEVKDDQEKVLTIEKLVVSK